MHIQDFISRRRWIRYRIRTVAGFVWAWAVLCSGTASGTGQASPPGRPSVTFILGEDNDDTNPYYRHAEWYFRHDDRDRTESVVTGCRSLADVLACLERERAGVPWGRINLVAHGNPYQGLRVAVVPGGPRATADCLASALAAGSVAALPARVTDSLSVIAIHGCGAGAEPGLLAGLRQLFSDRHHLPAVVANPYFEYYIAEPGTADGVRRFLADYWLLPYKKGYRPTDRSILRRLARRYPEAAVDWPAALLAGEAENPGDVFHMEFDVPVKWVIPFRTKKDMPAVDTQAKRVEWIRSNADIVSALGAMELDPGHFNWWFREVYVAGDGGARRPALWIKGYCTMLCILRLRPGD